MLTLMITASVLDIKNQGAHLCRPVTNMAVISSEYKQQHSQAFHSHVG